jgi:hypothetical protein
MTKQMVAAGLTVLGFRENLDELTGEYQKNAENNYGAYLKSKGIDEVTVSQRQWETEVYNRMLNNPQTDIQCLRSFEPDLEWSAPKQDLVDGALFFYLGDRARINVRACMREAQQNNEFQQYPAFMRSLQISADYIEKNARHLIGVAKVKGIAVYGHGLGFRGRNFAKIDSQNFHFFENPLPLDFLKSIPIVINGPTVYSLVGDKSTRIVNELRKSNKLPDWLDTMTFGDTLYSHITAENWLNTLPTTSIVIDSSATSSPEQLLRFHFFNYLIKAVADPKTPILEEASHWRGNELTGYSDYLFQVNGEWVVFEAKVNVNSERDILQQIKKYTESTTFNFSPENEPRAIKAPMPKHRVCLLGDQHGIYLTVDSQFIDCAVDRPRWHRTSLSREVLRDIRTTVERYIKGH